MPNVFHRNFTGVFAQFLLLKKNTILEQINVQKQPTTPSETKHRMTKTSERVPDTDHPGANPDISTGNKSQTVVFGIFSAVEAGDV